MFLRGKRLVAFNRKIVSVAKFENVRWKMREQILRIKYLGDLIFFTFVTKTAKERKLPLDSNSLVGDT